MNIELGIAPDQVAEPILVRKLNRLLSLSPRDRQVLARAMSLDVRNIGFRSILSETRSQTGKLAVMMDGWACCYRMLRDGSRHLVACYLPGDVCDLHQLVAARPNTVITLFAGARIARLSRETLAHLGDAHPRITRALWLDAQIASSIEREWTVNIARRGARGRVAHLLSEFVARADAVGLFQDNRLALPVVQSDLADACGLTAAHFNRVLRWLREDGLVSWRDHILMVPDRDALAAVADFCPDYLGLGSDPPPAAAPELRVPLC